MPMRVREEIQEVLLEFGHAVVIDNMALICSLLLCNATLVGLYTPFTMHDHKRERVYL